jgi:hypothetical protein
MTLCSDTVESNTASYGRGILIASGATVDIDSCTVANTINNSDNSGLNGSTANIDAPRSSTEATEPQAFVPAPRTV